MRVLASALLTAATFSLNATSIRGVGIESLFAQSDVVAAAKLVSGDIRKSPALYTFKVLQPFKGVRDGGTLTVGTFVGFAGQLDREYVLFLKKFVPRPPSGNPEYERDAGAVEYEETYGLRSIFPLGLTTAFGNEEIAVGVPSSVLLPPDIPLREYRAEDGWWRWAARAPFVALLQRLQHELAPTVR